MCVYMRACVCVKLNHFAPHLKLKQLCKLILLQFKQWLIIIGIVIWDLTSTELKPSLPLRPILNAVSFPLLCLPRMQCPLANLQASRYALLSSDPFCPPSGGSHLN